MPSQKQYKTPGVYVAELPSFPPSVVGVDTAVPVFIGYTQKAEVNGKPMHLKPVRVTSLAEFEQSFGTAYPPFYSLVNVVDPPPDGYDLSVKDPGEPDPGLKFYQLKSHGPSFNLYHSMQLFYTNGGGNCYVVSCGLYSDVTGNADLKALTDALDAAGEQIGPTMVVIPDAMLLPSDPPETGQNAMPWHSADYATLVQRMLKQCHDRQDRVAVLDVYGTQYLTQPPADDKTDKPTLDLLIETFRGDVGSENLNYGMAYFPLLHTSVVQAAGVTYASINNTPDTDAGGVPLQQLLSWQNFNRNGDPAKPENTRAIAVQKFIDDIPTAAGVQIATLNANLVAALPLLTDMTRVVLAKENVLPPSAAMAGVMTRIDAARGVWNAPANVTLTGVVRPSVALSNDQQADLNRQQQRLPLHPGAADHDLHRAVHQDGPEPLRLCAQQRADVDHGRVDGEQLSADAVVARRADGLHAQGSVQRTVRPGQHHDRPGRAGGPHDRAGGPAAHPAGRVHRAHLQAADGRGLTAATIGRRP
jgi:hypothetical protein